MKLTTHLSHLLAPSFAILGEWETITLPLAARAQSLKYSKDNTLEDLENNLLHKEGSFEGGKTWRLDEICLEDTGTWPFKVEKKKWSNLKRVQLYAKKHNLKERLRTTKPRHK